MARLESVSTDDLRGALQEVDEKQATQRLIAAIASKNGVTQRELATWFGVERKTIYNWLTRLESGDSLVEAARDEERPGRPRRLTDEQLSTLKDIVAESPKSAGYDATEWTAPLLKEFIRDRWDVSYSSASCRRLLADLGP